MPETIDTKVLFALQLMLKDKVNGINHTEFLEQGILHSAMDLVNKGYATKIENGKDNPNYCLNEKGVKYLDGLLEFYFRGAK